MTFHQHHFATGRPPENLNTYAPQEVKDCIALMVSEIYSESSHLQTREGGISTQELVVPNKIQTLNVKSKTSRKRTLDTSSSETSDQVSTSKEKAFVPFWTTRSTAWSRKLLSCTGSDLQDLDSTSWNSSSRKLALGSWFTVKMMTVEKKVSGTSPTSSQSQHSSSLPITDVVLQQIERDEENKKVAAEEAKEKKENERQQKRMKMTDCEIQKDIEMEEERKRKNDERESKKKVYDNPMRARRVKIYPTPQQDDRFKQYFGAVRYSYNMLVDKYKNVGQGGLGLADFRATIKSGPDWLKEIPCEIKDVAVRDFDKARKAHFVKLKKMKKTDKNAKLEAKFKFRSRRDKQQSFEVRPRDMVRKAGAFAFLGLDTLDGAEEIPEEAEAAGRFIRDRLGRTFLALPHQIAKRDESQAPTSRESIVALDPGVRTFQTTYDASGLTTEWGKEDMKQIYRLCLTADKIQSSLSKKKGAKRRSTKLAWHRVLLKIKHLVREVHRKMTTWLCENYKVVLIPKFETSRMVKRGKRKINSKAARSMVTWSHYTFREMLKAKAELFPWVTVVECDEIFTSKTCGYCGEINWNLGSSKVFRCRKCKYVADRDVSAARNILIRYLTIKGL